MRHSLSCALYIALLSGASAAAAVPAYERFRASDAETERVISDDYRHCMDASGGVTANMRDCSEAEGRRLNTRLTTAYRAAMARLPTASARARLRALERRWVATRYRHCDREARSEGGGTMALLIMDSCATDEDVRRIVWLEHYGRRR